MYVSNKASTPFSRTYEEMLECLAVQKMAKDAAMRLLGIAPEHEALFKAFGYLIFSPLLPTTIFAELPHDVVEAYRVLESRDVVYSSALHERWSMANRAALSEEKPS